MGDVELFCLIFFGVWAAVGAAFLLTALILWRVRAGREASCTEACEGVVVEVRLRKNQSGGVYCPVVEFVADGKPVRVESAFGSRPARYAVGQCVQVRYDPLRPTRFMIGDDSVLRLLEKIFLFIGLGSVLIGSVVSLIVSRVA